MTVRRKILSGKIDAQLVTYGKITFYLIPYKELGKITAEPGGRPRKPV